MRMGMEDGDEEDIVPDPQILREAAGKIGDMEKGEIKDGGEKNGEKKEEERKNEGEKKERKKPRKLEVRSKQTVAAA